MHANTNHLFVLGHRLARVALLAPCSAALAMAGCGGSSSKTSTTSSSSSSNPYATAYKSVAWGSTVTATYPSSCEMTLTTTGRPDYTPNAYYLVQARKLACNMKTMFAMLRQRREGQPKMVPMQAMDATGMPDGSKMRSGSM